MTNQSTHMRRAGLGIAASGIILALAALAPLQPIAHLFLRLAYWPMAQVPATFAVPEPLLLVISGGLTAGIGGLLWGLGTHVAPISPAAASKVAQIAGWSWFITDSTGSVAVGAPFNAVLNVVFLGVILYASGRAAETATAH